MGRKHSHSTARPVSELVGKVMEPVMKRRSGMTVALLNSWSDIVGSEFRHTTKPLRIDWQRRQDEGDPFEPATLLVGCDSASAVFFQHEQSSILERVNLFFGFQAIKRIKIVQQPVFKAAGDQKADSNNLDAQTEAELSEMLEDIDNQTLKETMKKLGRGVISQSRTA